MKSMITPYQILAKYTIVARCGLKLTSHPISHLRRCHWCDTAL